MLFLVLLSVLTTSPAQAQPPRLACNIERALARVSRAGAQEGREKFAEPVLDAALEFLAAYEDAEGVLYAVHADGLVEDSVRAKVDAVARGWNRESAAEGYRWARLNGRVLEIGRSAPDGTALKLRIPLGERAAMLQAIARQLNRFVRTGSARFERKIEEAVVCRRPPGLPGDPAVATHDEKFATLIGELVTETAPAHDGAAGAR